MAVEAPVWVWAEHQWSITDIYAPWHIYQQPSRELLLMTGCRYRQGHATQVVLTEIVNGKHHAASGEPLLCSDV